MTTHTWTTGTDTAARATLAVLTSEGGLVADCHRGLRGPYTGAGELVRLLVPEAYAADPALIRAHVIEILTVAPELREVIGAAPETLTTLAIPVERTRLYAPTRTRRIAHGLTEFLHACARLAVRETGRDTFPVAFTRLDEADHTDQEFLAILLRRTRTGPLRVTVHTRGDGGNLTEELRGSLAAHAHRAPAESAGRAPALTSPPARHAPGSGPGAGDHRRTRDALAHAYVEADGTSDDPAERAAYGAFREAEPEAAAALHAARAAALADVPGAFLGAIPYHLERGGDRARAGKALLTAAEHAVERGYYHALLELSRRGMESIDPRAETIPYWQIATKVTTALAVLGRYEEAEDLYIDLRCMFDEPGLHLFTGYAMAMIYTRFRSSENRDHRRAKALINGSIAIASQWEVPEERAFHLTFHQNGLALIEMHMGNLDEALRLVNVGMERLRTELGEDKHRLHKSVLVHNRGKLRDALGDARGALEDFLRVTEIDPNYPDYYFDCADVRRKLGDQQGALADYDKAISLSPPFWELHYNRGDLLQEMGRTREAAAEFARVVELEPDQAEARASLADLLLEADETEAVGTLVADGLRLDPAQPRLLCVRGMLALMDGETEAARADFDAALDADTTLVGALAARAALAHEAGDPARALADLDRALEQTPDDPDLLYNRAFVHAAAGSWDAAARDCAHALGLPGADREELLRLQASCAGRAHPAPDVLEEVS
ncbi:tetratricopeptide repeat protein [Streptomyces sp. NPDC048172]|uniref:tetratricopeptide repeat protein n=1 Tax=Streptomyces sp. NPDC048172 TaxID=3365505 RepID=UPI003711140D